MSTLYQIELTPAGVLTHLPGYSVAVLQGMSATSQTNAIIAELTRFSNQPAAQFANQPETDLVWALAVIIFLRATGLVTDSWLTENSTDDHRNALIVFNNKHTNVPVWRLQRLNDGQLVQVALRWYTAIEMTLIGVLRLLPTYAPEKLNSLNKIAPDYLRNLLIVLLSHFCNETVPVLQGADNDALIGKAAVIIFLRRAGLRTDAELRAMSTAQQCAVLIEENYYRTGITYQFLQTQPVYTNYQFMPPMTEQQLVQMALDWFVINKPYVKYNEVTWAMTHDSHTGDKETFGGKPSKDQDRTIQEQLASGIRALRIAADGTNLDGLWDGYLIHGHLAGGSPVAVFGKLEDFISHVIEFLQANPQEIITIVDESDNGWTDTINKAYLQAGSLLFTPGAKVTLPNNAGTLTLPTVSDLLAGNWPTIKDLVAANMRLVVLHNENYDTQYPWRLHSYDGSDGQFLISTDKDDYKWLTDKIMRPAMTTVQSESATRWGANTSLYLLNRYFYMQHANTSNKDFSKWEVGELIIEYTLLAWAATGRKPNFLMVDYYDNLAVPAHFLFELATAMNQPLAALGPEFVVQAITVRKPITLTDTNNLVVGAVYTLTCMAPNPNNAQQFYALSRAGVGNPVSLQTPDATDLNQQWRLIYNTPAPGTGDQATGFALVSPDGTLALYDPNWSNLTQSPYPPQPLTVKDFYGGEVGTGFAIMNGSHGQIIYKSNMQVATPYEAAESVLGVESRGDTVQLNDHLIRWQNNGQLNQYWQFTPVANTFTPPPLPPAPARKFSHFSGYYFYNTANQVVWFMGVIDKQVVIVEQPATSSNSTENGFATGTLVAARPAGEGSAALYTTLGEGTVSGLGIQWATVPPENSAQLWGLIGTNWGQALPAAMLGAYVNPAAPEVRVGEIVKIPDPVGFEAIPFNIFAVLVSAAPASVFVALGYADPSSNQVHVCFDNQGFRVFAYDPTQKTITWGDTPVPAYPALTGTWQLMAS